MLPLRPINALGQACVALAAALWSTSCSSKTDLFGDWPESLRGMLFSFWRAAFAGLVFLPAVRAPRWDPKLLAGLAASYTKVGRRPAPDKSLSAEV